MTIAAKSFVAVVNHFLVREAWARERLIPYAGKTARLVLSPVVIELAVQGDGMIAVPQSLPAVMPASGLAARGEPRGRVDVTITVPPSALSAFAAGGQAAVIKHVRIDGDAELAATIATLAKHLRWDAEEDLARLIGDAPAHRIASAVRGAAGYARRAGLGLVGSLTEYLLDEDPQLVRRTHLPPFSDGLVHTRDMLARIDKRIERAERAVETRLSRGGPLSDGSSVRSADDLH